MRLPALSLLLVLPLLAACDSNTPQAPSGDAAKAIPAKAAVATTSAAAAVPGDFPIGARPLLGTWAADPGSCGDPNSVQKFSPTSYEVGDRSCDLALADNGDGSFAASCGSRKLTLTPIFGPSGEGIRIAEGDAKPTNVFRCSR